jgi:hypothetical protein
LKQIKSDCVWRHLCQNKAKSLNDFKRIFRGSACRPEPPQTAPQDKMHGSVDIENKDNDYFLITEEDYVDFLASQGKGITIPQPLVEHLERQDDQLRFLFLGYGLQDWNFRVMLQKLRNKAKPAARKERRKRGVAR